MLKVGLTGSIAVGKSYVLEVFRELGAFTLDADLTAREVVAPNTKGLRFLVENFGEEILLPSGELDRARLARQVFADETKREILNSIVHPLVIEAQNEWLNSRESENPSGIAVIDAALMIESGGYKRFDKIVVVFCESAIQLKRLISRNNLSKIEAAKRINSQLSQEEKKRYADFLIDSSKGFDDTRRQTVEVFEQLKLFIEPEAENGKL